MTVLRTALLLVAVVIGLGETGGVAEAQTQESAIVINEIHCNPDVETELVEFVELYNTGTTAMSLSGWFFSKGITYTFPAATTLASHGYLIVAENPTAIRTKWGSGTSAVPVNLIFGPFTGHLNGDGEKVQLCNALGQVMDEVKYQLGFPWPTVGDAVPDSQPGTGRSMQLINPALDNDLGGSWRSAAPTPAKLNSAAYVNNAPPAIRQVEHSPEQPAADDEVTITAKVTDSDGVLIVQLKYQIVEPGSYVPVTIPNFSPASPTLPNSDYAKGWTTVAMHDDGLNGDLAAGDDVYTVQLPASVQKHRRLIRYTLAAGDVTGSTIEVPYADDDQPNFAYFVYNGVPAWKGAIQPGSSDPAKARVVTYSAELMQSLPVYHLLARATDIENSQYSSAYNDQRYHCSGTLIYDGQVYDNIHFRIRGTVSTYMTGKNKWKLDFNRGHYFQARDDYGNKYTYTWRKMNLGTGTCPWWQYPHPGPWDQGTQGMVMNEVLGFRLYAMAGVPGCTTNYAHFRIIDGALEANPASQYEGDFWGLYFAIEQVDGVFLDEHGLPDGNVYRMEGGANPNHQGATDVPNNGADVTSFANSIGSRPSSAWWAQNANLANYYNSKAVGVAINDSDRRPQYNCVYYHNSETGQWWMLPWDLDLSFEWGTHYTTWENWQNALIYPEYNLAYKNRARELLDLLFNGDQASQVIDEIAAVIATPYEGNTFVEANRALWDYHPKTKKKGQFYQNNEFLKTRDWPGLVDYYKTYLTPVGMSGTGTAYAVKALTAEAADSAIPNTPTVTYAGSNGFPLNNLKFRTTAFSSPSGSTFAAMKWRIAEVEVGSRYIPPQAPADDETPATTGPVYPGRLGKYEVDAVWESDELTTFNNTVTIPASVVVPGSAYRVRCRMEDKAGRWSHWSDPVQFVAGQ